MKKGAQVFAPFGSVVESLIHPSCQASKEEKQRHRLFLSIHLVASLVALAAMPVYLLAVQPTGMHDGLLPLWMLAPLASAAYLSRTGQLTHAFLLSITLAAGFIAWVSSMTGGIFSPHLIWLGTIPLEVALFGNRRILSKALGICTIAVAGLAGLQFGQLVRMPAPSANFASMVGSLSVMCAIIYGASLAVRIEALNRGLLKSARDGEMRYRKIADTVSDMITRHDVHGDVTFASSGATSLIGVSSDLIKGNGLFQRIHIPDRPAYLQALSQVMNRTSDHNSPVTVELRLMKANSDLSDSQNLCTGMGELIWVEMKCAPELNSKGHVMGVVAASRDICARKSRQNELEAARNEAEKANIAKTRFLANVTHELRTPLNTIIGFSELLGNPAVCEGQPERQKEYADLIHSGGHHLLQLVNALLDVSRIESGNFEVNPQHFDMHDLISNTCKMMQAQADKRNIALFADFKVQLSDVYVDPRACRQILLNLMSNAVKFSDDGDQVKVQLDWARKPNGNYDKSKLAIKVIDNGIGIDEKDIPRLGTPFVQADTSYQRRYEGAGIGLSIVKGLAELQSGSLKVESRLGHGSVMTITLPMEMEDEFAGDSDTSNEASATSAPTSIVTMGPTPSEAAEQNQPAREAGVTMTRGGAVQGQDEENKSMYQATA